MRERIDKREIFLGTPEDFKEFIIFLNKNKDVPVSIISKEDLIKNKKASGRYRDLADAEDLENA